jgi:ATP-binding cassette subfamily B (MDR/TAP) protein 1
VLTALTTGCGKTSIISLLERFYSVQTGKILLQDRDIKELDVKEYRKSISLVAQESSLFDATIRENILLGVDASSITDSDLHSACRSADIHDFISSLPDGYSTKVGARGVALSGGQKQRIAIARALIRNPRILLLDEATSNLDSETERSVQAVFEKTGRGRTMVVVAHRLATVQNADVIFVVGDGRVVESGNHASLLKRRGLYYQMVGFPVLETHVLRELIAEFSACRKRSIGRRASYNWRFPLTRSALLPIFAKWIFSYSRFKFRCKMNGGTYISAKLINIRS